MTRILCFKTKICQKSWSQNLQNQKNSKKGSKKSNSSCSRRGNEPNPPAAMVSLVYNTLNSHSSNGKVYINIHQLYNSDALQAYKTFYLNKIMEANFEYKGVFHSKKYENED